MTNPQFISILCVVLVGEEDPDLTSRSLASRKLGEEVRGIKLENPSGGAVWGQRERLVWVTLGLRHHGTHRRGQEPVDSGDLSSEGSGAGADQKCMLTDMTEASGMDSMAQGSCERRMGKGIQDRALEGSLVSKGRGQVQEGTSQRWGKSRKHQGSTGEPRQERSSVPDTVGEGESGVPEDGEELRTGSGSWDLPRRHP